jgi:acyl-CoA synthetase (AMP-forming)/AMP-acid ligase II
VTEHGRIRVPAVPETRLGDDPPWRSVGDLVRAAALRFGDRDALRFGSDRLSFAELEAATDSVAGAFAAKGVMAGDRVALMLPNGLDFPVCWLALLKLGAVAVPVNTGLKSADLHHVLADALVSLAIAPEELEDLVTAAGVAPVAEVRAVVDANSTTPLGSTLTAPETLANLQYTSGTTGLPKACMLTHDYWLRLGWLVAGQCELTTEDVVLTAQPFTYMDPQWNVVMCLIAGATLVILPRFSARGFWNSVRESEATFFYILGTMPQLLLKQSRDVLDRQNDVRLVLCSGIVPALHATLEERWGAPWREAYGMTETGADLFTRSWEHETVGTGTVGRAVPTKEVRIVDDAGCEVSAGQPGELCVRGRPMMSGYWNRPDATAAAIRNGWMHTGDIARADEAGRIYLLGRKKDIVRRGGENIACAEVEGVLLQLSAIASAALVPEPDELFGEEPKAFVQLIRGQAQDVATARMILEFARERLARFKVPRFVAFVDEFPRTPSEKIDKPRLLAEQSGGAVYDALCDAMVLAEPRLSAQARLADTVAARRAP